MVTRSATRYRPRDGCGLRRCGVKVTDQQVDCDWLRSRVITALKMLGSPASVQSRYLKGGRLHHDELALELDDVAAAFVSNCAPGKPVTMVLRALDQQLDRISGASNISLWTDQALATRREWSVVRGYARNALFRLGEDAPAPSGTSRDGAEAMRQGEIAMYELVLKHTVEVGNGWGRSPSPLLGFYVLDRLAPDLDDPDFNPAALDDPDLGELIPPTMMGGLIAAIPDVRIEFVASWMPLVDLEATRNVLVKNNGGFVALGTDRDVDGRSVVGVYFYAGGLWSRSNRYELSQRDSRWEIVKFQNVVVS
jgi:hypothetical protein